MSDHEVRELRYQLKQAHKQLGKQGETIHRLRCENAELLGFTDPSTRALMRLWMDGNDRQCLLDTIKDQELKIADLEGVRGRLLNLLRAEREAAAHA